MSAKMTQWAGKWLGIILGLVLCVQVQAGSRIYHCVGPEGELVFRDQPCKWAGLSKAGERKAATGRRSNQEIAETSVCGFESDPLALAEPWLKRVKLSLIVEIDADGPYLSIAAEGQHDLDPAPLPALEGQPDVSAETVPEPASDAARTSPFKVATFDFRVSSQGLRFADGRFIEAEWRMGAQTLGFGRSRMRSLLSALSQQPASVVVWFEGDSAPVSAATMAAEDFRLALDNARRCWKTRVQRPAPQ